MHLRRSVVFSELKLLPLLLRPVSGISQPPASFSERCLDGQSYPIHSITLSELKLDASGLWIKWVGGVFSGCSCCRDMFVCMHVLIVAGRERGPEANIANRFHPCKSSSVNRFS